jgi:hypothetical protein
LECGGLAENIALTSFERFLRTPTLVRLRLGISFSSLTSSGVRSSELSSMDQAHQRLARHLNNEQIAWDEILRSMDSYVQRLTVAISDDKGSAKEPCDEYKVLEKNGMKSLQKHRTQSGIKITRDAAIHT